MRKSLIILAILLCGAVFFTACEYEFIVHPDTTDPEGPGGDDPISFSQQIVPIFTSRCLNCHDTGDTSPDLSAANAYSSITSDNLVNTTNPESSILYDYIKPSTSGHSWRKYTNNQAALVLKWIEEGAKNN